MKLLITGGSGCIGQELVRQLHDKCEKIIIYSRSESRQAEMMTVFPENYSSAKDVMRYRIGDIRDVKRLTTALQGVTHVIHAAALKRIEVCARDVRECVKTNVDGSVAVADACIAAGVKKCVFISTDKACEALTAYGKAKALSEDIFIQSNNMSDTRFSCVRYANVEASTGSLLKIWDEQYRRGDPLTITHRDMTRMWISKEQAAAFVIMALENMQGGEIFVPNCNGRSILSMAQEVYPDYPIRYTGIRPSEKLHEILISEADARDCWRSPLGCFIVYPSICDWRERFEKTGEKMPESFRLSSKVSDVVTEFADPNY